MIYLFLPLSFLHFQPRLDTVACIGANQPSVGYGLGLTDW